MGTFQPERYQTWGYCRGRACGKIEKRLHHQWRNVSTGHLDAAGSKRGRSADRGFEIWSITGLHYRATEHIREEMWCKFRLNVCNNLPQAVLGAGVGCYRDSAHMRQISDGLREELESIAAAKGIDISKADLSSGHGSVVPPSVRYSTLQDLDAGCHTEIDMFSGALIRMGKLIIIKKRKP